MRNEELQFVLSEGEGLFVEFKERLGKPLAQEIVAFANASGDIMIEVFKTQIIISNPGGLVSWLNPKDFGKYSRSRNNLIASMLMRTPYVEKMGTGILRINSELSRAGLAEAEFCFDEHNFSITFNSVGKRAEARKSSPKNLPKTADLILELIRANPQISTSKIGEDLGISKRAVLKQTHTLKQGGRFRYVGPARGGHWELIKGVEGSNG